MNVAIITAGGSGERSELKFNKNLFFFDGSTVIEKTVSAFLSVDEIDEIIITAPKNDVAEFKDLLLPLSKKIRIVVGGKTRTESVNEALKITDGEFVLIHDGARPFITPELIKKCLYKAINEGNCIPTTPLTETAGKIKNGKIVNTERCGLLNLQTPQVFKTDEIKKAYSLITPDDSFTDDCGAYCKYIGKCNFIDGDKNNKKLTYKPDFEALLPTRNGIGYDIHTLTEGRKLILGGVEIPHDKGLLGHSDADVLIHALMDAMLSACSLKDIGNYFPDTDPRYKDISSVILLKEVLKLVKKQGYKPVNASFSVIAEKPKLSPYVDSIKKNLALILKISENDVGIACTTNEGVGLIGSEKAIAVVASCTLSADL